MVKVNDFDFISNLGVRKNSTYPANLKYYRSDYCYFMENSFFNLINLVFNQKVFFLFTTYVYSILGIKKGNKVLPNW